MSMIDCELCMGQTATETMVSECSVDPVAFYVCENCALLLCAYRDCDAFMASHRWLLSEGV